MSNIYYWKKWRFQNLSEIKISRKKIWRNALALKSKKAQGIFGETFTLALLSSAVFRLQNCVLDFFNLFCLGDKRLLSELLGKWGWFQEHNEHFPKKLRHSFEDERALITITLISSCHWKTLVLSYLRKKRPANAFLTLTVNYRKIAQKNNLYHPK